MQKINVITKLHGDYESEIRWARHKKNSFSSHEAILYKLDINSGIVNITLTCDSENVDFIISRFDSHWNMYDITNRTQNIFQRLFDEDVDFYPITAAKIICQNAYSKYHEIKNKCADDTADEIAYHHAR